MTKSHDIVLLSTADWDNPFWTNKQHLARELAKMGHRVLYIESLGLRTPSVHSSDLRRILRRLRRGFSKPRYVEENIHVCSPAVIPLQKYTFVRYLNRWLLRRVIIANTRRAGIARDLLWTYNPLACQLLNLKEYNTVVYHCVDEIKAQPGMPAVEIETAERELLVRADVSFVTSNTLLDARQELSSNIHLFENVADFDHFNNALSADLPLADDLADIPKPVIGFIGAISSYKVDFELLARLAGAHPEWTLVLIGKVGEGEPATSVEALEQYSNIRLFGPRSYKDLPRYIKGFDVAIIPATLNTYTHAMFPMKFYEYLAAGRRIVSTNIASLRKFEHVLTLADSHDDFIAGIEAVLENGRDSGLEDRLELAKKNTYVERTRRMMEIVEGAHEQT